jgi:alpha-tubulin suppressor-like RCC1 family protein
MAVSAGLAHSCALTTDGAVWCWGRNDSGQVGDSSRAASTGPVRLRFGSAPRIVQLVSGAAHNCALDASGRVWCWGRNTRGAVGDGTTTSRLAPTRVPLPGGAAAVAAGTAHSCATLVDGRTFCWGDNADGQIGDGTRAPRLTPARVRYSVAGAVPAIAPAALGRTRAALPPTTE